MLRSGENSPQEHTQYLDRLEHETERIRTTIGDLLDFARPSSQEITELDLNIIVREVCAMISCNKEFRAINIEQELDPALPILQGNDRLMRQMLLNLVLNACDAMQPDGGTLKIETALDTGAVADTIRIVVCDTGRGIEPDEQKKIFDPFFTTKDNGTGLGLANVHRIVELMAGSISVESAAGRGAAFTILLPAAAAKKQDR
jgi:two-component system sensor histidine kinase HydH